MFLAGDVFIQVLIIVGAMVLFLGTFMLNRKTKVPKDVEPIDKCNTCFSDTCIVKISDVEKIKEELREQINKCEDYNEKN